MDCGASQSSCLGKLLQYPEAGIFQRDPFVATMFGYIHHCLYEISKLLNKVIVFTFNKETPHQQKTFFLTGFDRRKGFFKKLYGNPGKVAEGMELKWLVKNIRWHLQIYANNLNVYEDVLDDLTGFLFDTILKSSLGSSFLTEISYDRDLLNDCIEVGEEIIGAIEESEYYESLTQFAVNTRKNFKSIRKLVDEYQNYINAVNEIDINNLDSVKTLDFVQNTIVKQLQEETCLSADGDNVSKKPLTNYVSFSIMPRFTKPSNEDSGIIADIDNSSSLPDSLQQRTFHGSSSTPCRYTSTPSKAMEASMVIIDTPVLRNKHLDLTKNTPKTKAKERKGNSDGEIMDGSFVLI